MTDTKPTAQRLYEAYCTSADWRSAISGAPLPQWADATPAVRTHWEVAANAINGASVMGLRRFIEERLKQHKDNLAGWSEGEQCSCFQVMNLGPNVRGVQFTPNPNCLICHGTGRSNRGFLVPTEPDPEERAAVRERLTVAISELEIVLKEMYEAER